jgi:hypothetical protein
MDRAVPVLPPPKNAPARPKRRWWQWGSSFLTISILVHLLFGVGAAYLIVQKFTAKSKPTFTAASAPSAPAAASREHKVQMQKKQQTMTAPTQMKRVTTAALNSRVALPQMPDLPTLATSLSPAMMPGMSGASAGFTMGGTGSGNPGSGRPVSLFGLNGSGTGLEGTFYDYKMNQAYQPIKGVDTAMFAKICKEVLPTSGAWHPEKPFIHFTSPAKLHGRYFVFPAIQDVEAGSSFQSPRSGPGSWLAVYRGAFAPSVSGSYRFVGFGDNVMVVQVGNRIVLDASDHGYTGAKREALGNIAFPGKDQTPLFAGPWLDLSADEPKDIEIAVGDEGGIFCSGLFIQPKDVPYAQGDQGIPKLPIFVLGTLSEADRELLGKSFPPVCLQGPTFKSMPSSSSDSVFSH